MTKPDIAFIGTGIMGRPMALNLLRAGYRVTAYNRTREKMKELLEAGAAGAESPKEAAADATVAITIVTDAKAVREVVLGPEGVLEGLNSGDVLVDMSTIDPATEKEIAEALGDRGASLIDAPVSGGDVGAQKGTLAIMAGGDEEIFRRVRPVFEVLGSSITYCGPTGHGQLTKLCNQILVSVNLLAVCEALSFARRTGLDPEVMIEATRGGAAGSWQLTNLAPRIVAGDFAPGFMVDLMQKDLGIVLSTAFASSTSVLATSLVHQLFNALQAAGGGQQGTQALARVLERIHSE